MRGGMFTDGDGYDYTPEDIRFTQKGGNIYAIVMKYPEDGNVSVKSLGTGALNSDIESVDILGFDETPQWSREWGALHIKTENVSADYPVAFRIRLK